MSRRQSFDTSLSSLSTADGGHPPMFEPTTRHARWSSEEKQVNQYLGDKKKVNVIIATQ
jgi:hypothetical protein